MRRALIALVALLTLAGCANAPLDAIADKVVDAETREQRETRVYGFAAIITTDAVGSTQMDDIEKTRLFTNQVVAALDAFDADEQGIWVETNLMNIAQVFAGGAASRIRPLISLGAMPTTDQMLKYLDRAGNASAMLRDVKWVMERVNAGTMTADLARDAFRERIEGAIARLSPPAVPPAPVPAAAAGAGTGAGDLNSRTTVNTNDGWHFDRHRPDQAIEFSYWQAGASLFSFTLETPAVAREVMLAITGNEAAVTAVLGDAVPAS